jgi:cephalosporin-C deacetylase-like acetyl esterase
MAELVCTLMFSLLAAPDEKLIVLDKVSSPSNMMTTYLNRLADEALERRAVERDALKTAEEIVGYQKDLRGFFLEQLGPLPERTLLDAQVVDKQTRDGYRFEKIIFESRPGMFVTGVLFLPTSDPPYPGVLVPCGHSVNGKANDVYQRACIFLAQNGIASFVYDPIGQGERYQIIDKNGKPRFGNTTEHTIVGVGCILLGANTAAYRIWDGMRAMDYLVSRPEIDPKRIGCTGNSGGGTLTCYLMALDDRIVCAAPGCYITSFKRLLAEAGPQDAEQNIHGQITKGMDHADYIMMRAPKPTLVLCATGDFFDIRGTWDSFREAKRLYAKLGFAERVDILEANEKHGYSLPLRTGMVRWMRRWLCGIDDPVTEGDFTVLTDQEMQCSPKGQVLLMYQARSVFQINADLEKESARQRRKLWESTPRDTLLGQIRAIAGVRPLKDLPEPEVKHAGTIERNKYSIEKVVLTPEPGIVLPGLVFVPRTPGGEAYLYLHGGGKDVDAASNGRIEQLVLQGHLVFAVDLRGIGETASVSENKEWNDRFGGGWKDFFSAYLLGKSYVGMRTEDILVCARYLARYSAERGPREIHVIAMGECGPPALHAVALEPGCFASLRLERSVRSWSEVVRTPLAKQQLMNTVHGALRVYDLPDLLSLIPKDRVAVKDSLKLGEEKRS